MAEQVPSTIQVPVNPTHWRVMVLVPNFGRFSNDGNGAWIQFPYIEAVVIRCEPVLNADGTPKLNEFQQPCYNDFPGTERSVRFNPQVTDGVITGPGDLAQFLSLFPTIIDAAYPACAAVINTWTTW